MVDTHFENIKNMYDSFYNYLLVEHAMFPVKETENGFWGISVAGEIHDLFKKIDLHKYNHLLDMGSGDGKVVMIASLFTNATGVEADPWLHDVANDVKDKLFHVPHVNRANFVKDDFMNHDLSNYDLIFMNPDSKDPNLIRKISEEFNGRLVMYNSETEYLEASHKTEINGSKINIYDI